MTVEELINTFDGDEPIDIYDGQYEDAGDCVGNNGIGEPYAKRPVKGWRVLTDGEGDPYIEIRI